MIWTDDRPPRVLVAAPTYDGCGYALQPWADAFRAFTYPEKGALFVDNSDNAHYAHICRAAGIPTIIQSRRFSFLWDTLEVAWRTIIEYAHDEGYDLIASIEADIICPPNTLTLLVHEWKQHGPKAVVAHRYHPRGIDNPAPPPEGMTIDREKLADYAANCWFDTLGCVLFPTDLMWETRDLWTTITEVELYKQVEDQGYKRIRLKDRLDIVHLEDHSKQTVHLYGEECVEETKISAAPGRLHPAELGVKKLYEEPEKTGWHGRKDDPTQGFAIRQQRLCKPTGIDSPEAKKARDDLKWATLTASQPAEWTCARCGKCCGEFDMFTANDEPESFLKLHGFEYAKQPDGRLKVRIAAPCERLIRNEDGTTSCADYDNRPHLCAAYKCGQS